MKTCYYTGDNGRYRWAGNTTTSCILAVFFNKPISGDMIILLERSNIISDFDAFVIRTMDLCYGGKGEIAHLRKLGKEIGVKILKK